MAHFFIYYFQTEQKFLAFFFRNLRNNEYDRYKKAFPFVSLCGNERNYLNCEDLPYVITKLDEKNDLIQLNMLQSSDWLFHFDPLNLFHNPRTGRLYYLFEDKQIISHQQIDLDNTKKRNNHIKKLPCKIGLVKSEISMHLMSKMKAHDDMIDDKHYRFEYKGKKYELNFSRDSRAFELLNEYSRFKEHDNSENKN